MSTLRRRLAALERRAEDVVIERMIAMAAREFGMTPAEYRAAVMPTRAAMERERAQYPTEAEYIAAIAAEVGLTVAELCAEAEASRRAALAELAAERAGGEPRRQHAGAQ